MGVLAGRTSARSLWLTVSAVRAELPVAVPPGSAPRQMVALLAMDINLGELFARPVLKHFAKVVMDTHLAQVDPDEMARLLQLLGDSTIT